MSNAPFDATPGSGSSAVSPSDVDGGAGLHHEADRADDSGLHREADRASDSGSDATNDPPTPEPAREAHLVVSGPFLDSHDDAQIAAYVDAIAAAAADGGDAEDLERLLRERLDAAGVALPEESYANLARQIWGSGGRVSVSTDDGRTLLGAPETEASEQTPDVHGTDDPADPDRPFYS